MAIDQNTRTELEAAVYRRLVEHLRTRADVQNIDLMNLAGFCRNCLSNWMKDAADAKGIPMTKEQSREIVYGIPYDEWRAKHQKEASAEQKAAFEKEGEKHCRPWRGPVRRCSAGEEWARGLPASRAAPNAGGGLRELRHGVSNGSCRRRQRRSTRPPFRQGSAQSVCRAGRAARGREKGDRGRHPRCLCRGQGQRL